MLPCNAVPQLQVCQSTRAAQTPALWAFWPCLKLAHRSDLPGLPLTPRPLTQEQMRAAAAPAIRAMQAKNEIAPAGQAPRQCDWKQVEASVRKRFQTVVSGREPFFVAGGHHLVILVDGTDAEKPVLKSLLDEWLDPARQSSNLIADEKGRAFLDSIDPAYASIVLQGEPRRIRALRAELEEIALASNKLAAQMSLIERDDLGRLSLEAASEQYRAWLAEARMAGLDKEGIERLDALMLRFISVGSTLRNEQTRPQFVRQALISEHAIHNGCTFSVLMGGHGAKEGIPFSMYLRGLVIHASRPLTSDATPPVSASAKGRAAISNTRELIAAMRTEHGVEVELLGPNSRRVAPGLGLTGKLLLVSAYGEQDEARLLAHPLAELLRRDSKQALTILRSPHALPLAASGSLVYDLADDLDEQIESLTLKSAAALRQVHGFLLSHGMLDLIDESHMGFSVQAARSRIDGMGRGFARERGHRLLNDYEYYEHAAAHLHRRRWRGLFLQMANYLDQPVGKEGLALLPMAAEDAEAVFQFLHDDRELVERLQQKLLVARLHTAAPAEAVQERVELM